MDTSDLPAALSEALTALDLAAAWRLAADGTGTRLAMAPLPAAPMRDATIRRRDTTTLLTVDGTLLFLYTDGLVENRARDIDDGLARLLATFGPGAAARPLEDLCQAALDGVYDDQHRDDIAMLVARLARIPADHHATWELPAEPAAVRRARGLVRDRLARWDLDELTHSTMLLVSELVTNAIQHAGGRITLRLVREGGLVCEVFDSSDGAPRIRFHDDEDDMLESGRGLHVVGRLAKRWGVRRTAGGKVVWCEQELP